MKKIFMFVVLVIFWLIVGVVFYQMGARVTAERLRPQDANRFCATRKILVYAEPSKELPAFDVIQQRAPVWWSGVRKGKWLWVDYELGAGWIEETGNNIDACSPEPLPDGMRIFG